MSRHDAPHEGPEDDPQEAPQGEFGHPARRSWVVYVIALLVVAALVASAAAGLFTG